MPRSRVIMDAGAIHKVLERAVFRPRSQSLGGVWTASPGSVNAFHLTMRAADKWESARFSGLWLAWGWFRFQSESTLPPLAANAGR